MPASDLLNLPGDPVVCLLRPYDEVLLQFGSYSLPEGFSMDVLLPLVPFDDEFVLVIVGPKGTLSNRYKIDGDLSVQPVGAEPITVCAPLANAIILVQRRAGQMQVALTNQP